MKKLYALSSLFLVAAFALVIGTGVAFSFFGNVSLPSKPFSLHGCS